MKAQPSHSPDDSTERTSTHDATAGRAQWRRRWLLWALNCWLVFHLSAIIIAPASVSPSSDATRLAWTLFRPYLQALFLNHGFHFFAPEPVPSTLVAFVAERADGTIVQGRIPDRATVPRLLYHRTFMLCEQMDAARPDLQKPWCESYARHLGHKYGARQVGLSRVTHYLPTMEMVRSGVKLDDPASYTEQPLGVFPCNTF
jgi:hypothetical protein